MKYNLNDMNNINNNNNNKNMKLNLLIILKKKVINKY